MPFTATCQHSYLICLQTLGSLPEDLAIEVQRSSGQNLHHLMAVLPEALHSLALRSDFHTLASEGTLIVDCSEHSLLACTTALKAFSLIPEARRLSVRWISLKTSETGSITAFAEALYEALASDPADFELTVAKVADDHLSALLSSLKKGSSLRKLSLSSVQMVANRFDRETTEHDQQQLACTLADGNKQLTGLESISLQDKKFERNDALQLRADIISPSLQSLTRLTQLSLGSSFKDAAVNAEVLNQLDYLRSLELFYHAVMTRHASNFAAALQRLLQLTSLKLSFIGSHELMKEAQSSTAAGALAQLKGFQRLDLSACCMPGSAVSRLAEGVKSMKTLQRLSVCIASSHGAASTLCGALVGSPCTQLKLRTVQV